MKELELLIILNNVKSEYILEAQQLRSGEAKNTVRKVSRKRVILIAAVITLLLLLAGCAAILLGLEDLSFGPFQAPYTDTPSETREYISLQGFAGTPEYLAGKEWLTFRESYDTDGKLLASAPFDDYVEPEAYWVYNCYTKEMVDKANEILEKYDLNMPLRSIMDVSSEELFDAVGIEGIVSPEASDSFTLGTGSYFDDGSFEVEGNTLHASQLETGLYFHYLCLKKGTLYDRYGIIENPAAYEQWEYTTKDGTHLLMAVGTEESLLIADKKECFISVSISSSLNRKTFEAIADGLDFTYSPKAIDLETADRRIEESRAQFEAEVEATRREYRKATYADFFANYINTEDGVFYSLLDVNGDGLDEVAYYWGGMYQELFTIQDGYVQKIHEGGYAFAHGYDICRAENGEYLFYTYKSTGAQIYVSFLYADGLDLKYKAFFRYDYDSNPERPWAMCTNAPGHEVYEFLYMPMNWETIDSEKYMKMVEAYPVQNLLRYPIHKLISPPDPNEKEAPEKIVIGVSDLSAAAEYYQAQYPDEEVKAYLHDFDSNGSGDLAVWRGGAFWALYVTDEQNRVKAEYRMDESLGFDIYETYTKMANQVRYDGNLIGIIEKGAYETYYKFCSLGSNGLYLRECFKFDPNGEESCYFVSVTDSWDIPYDAEITQWKPLSEAEYAERLESYLSQPYDLKPISEYFYVGEDRIVPGGTPSAEDMQLSDSEKAALKKEADERLLLCLKDQYSFYRGEDGMEYTLADYCRQQSAELGFPVSITRYTFVDMDGDGVQEAVVDFRFGENEQVMCMVLRYYCGSLYGTEFYHRQLSQIKEDGTFAYSGGGDNDGWAKLRWENMEWVTEKVGPIHYGDSLKDVTWYPYPVDVYLELP